MTLVFKKNAWHYWLVRYTFGEEFFTEIDWNQTLKISEAFNDIQWVRKTKTVNFCPYCRAVVSSLISFPFIFVWRLLPHKDRKEETHEQVMKRSKRNSKIIRMIVAVFMGGMAIIKILNGEYLFSLFYLGLVLFNIYNVKIMKWLLKHLPKFKTKKITKGDSKSSSKIFKKIESKHDLVCPPIFFIDVRKDYDLK